MFQPLVFSTLIVSLFIFVYLLMATFWLRSKPIEGSRAKMITMQIARGADTFLRTEYAYIGVVVAVTALGLCGGTMVWGKGHHLRWINYIIGALCSMVAGLIGMRIATVANGRTATAAQKGLTSAFRLSFVGGTVMGMGVVVLALLGMVVSLVVAVYWINGVWSLDQIKGKLSAGKLKQVLEIVTGFVLGAETIALFARVAGGIYTKSADVGADIAGKVELGIPEDDPRNPATIADNVGDNVGDIAGMGADLFGSYVSTLLAAMILGVDISLTYNGVTFLPALLLPLAVGVLGVVASAIGAGSIYLQGGKNPEKTFHQGNMLSLGVMALATYALIDVYFDKPFVVGTISYQPLHLWGAVAIGLFLGLVITFITSWFTAMEYSPVQFIVKQSKGGPATNVLAGLSIGMFSIVVPMLLFAVSIYACYSLAGFYGVTMAATSMVSTTPLQLSLDAFGPIADNAGGIAELSGADASVRKCTDKLDAVGNTTAATGKAFAIASAAMTALGLLTVFVQSAQLEKITINDPAILIGVFLGAMVPFLFSGLTINAVGKAAMKMVAEIRRQFTDVPGIMEGTTSPDYERCISIATQYAIREMIFPGLLVLALPPAIWYAFGANVLAAFLIGVVTVGTAMAFFQCNAGGAWDNAKKCFEKGGTLDGHVLAKGTPEHAAAVVGDTVGDPFKDTAGPAMNILIKLTIIVALILVSP